MLIFNLIKIVPWRRHLGCIQSQIQTLTFKLVRLVTVLTVRWIKMFMLTNLSTNQWRRKNGRVIEIRVIQVEIKESNRHYSCKDQNFATTETFNSKLSQTPIGLNYIAVFSSLSSITIYSKCYNIICYKRILKNCTRNWI